MSFRGIDPTDARGHLIAYDLVADKVVWKRSYEPSIDSMALTPDGRKLYMPCGEERGDCDTGLCLTRRTATRSDASRCMRAPTTRLSGSAGGGPTSLARCTIGWRSSTRRTDRVVRWVGPFGDSIRPFTVSRDGRLVFVHGQFPLGF